MRLKWMPWRTLVRYVARRHGFLDPIALLTQLQRFIQPSEVNEPVELLRAGAVMHARGLINNRVIQHNLDWVWPYWIERQFNPRDISYIPRAFSITHINLSHRNWTAIGLPDFADLPIVDPCGLLTPFIDGWSLDSWLVTKQGRMLIPSKARSVSQSLRCDEDLTVITEIQDDDLRIVSQAKVIRENNIALCCLDVEAFADQEAWLVLTLRPYNPEGISFVYETSLNAGRNTWLVDGQHSVEFNYGADKHHVSNYHHGDVYIHLNDRDDQQQGECDVGMLTAAALFKLDSDTKAGKLSVRIPLQQKADKNHTEDETWQSQLRTSSSLKIPHQSFHKLYDIALRSLLLHSSEDIYPGPYTYKRFWFRDAVFIINALLCAGLTQRAEQALDKFSSRQNLSGYFHSQQGEWDSNGEVLWVLHRFCLLTNRLPKPEWVKMIRRGADWIINKRLPADSDSDYAGLLPAGFSAEHLGPNNYYYWDNFWGIAGLKAASAMFALLGDQELSVKYQRTADEYQAVVDRSLLGTLTKLQRPAMPAAPNRRLDAGAIGSLALGYPTQLCDEDDHRLLDTADFLLEHCCIDNGFFQDMTHSGINPYLTLHMAQVLMRAGDLRYEKLMQQVADLATSTGQWPEAIHPRTGGGCMGDGQHVWAAAEWVLMLRNCFLREENNCLVIGAGVSKQWLMSQQVINFGPAATTFGVVQLIIEPRFTAAKANTVEYLIYWQAKWYNGAPAIEVRLPGQPVIKPDVGANSIKGEFPL